MGAATRHPNSRTAPLALTVVVLLIVAGSVLVVNPIPGVTVKSPTQLELFLDHIKHVVVVVMENHAFDSIYGAYCQTQGPYCPTTVAGTPPGTCVPYTPSNPSQGCIRPWAFGENDDSLEYHLLHTRNSSLASWNNGSMNGFYHAEDSGLIPFGYYDANTTPLMWDFAEEYGLADNYFSGFLSYSLPTHWSFVSGGNGPPVIQTYGLGDTTGGYAPPGVRTTYLQEAQNVTAVEDLLNNTTTSWNYYEFPLGTWANASNTNLVGGPGVANAFNYWNPEAAKKESYAPQLSSHFVANQQFFGDAANGTLPQLSWVIPYFRFSEHPAANISLGDQWLSELVDSVESSPDWNTTALFITYDEYGGFYDNAPPPVVNGTQLGFRLPLVVISPYTAEGQVVSSLIDPWSILSLFEAEGNLGCMSDLDCYSPSALSFFNFTAPPRPPILFPNNDTLAPYPMGLQPTNAPWAPVNWTVPYSIAAGFGQSSGFVD
jgi:phospholipase C